MSISSQNPFVIHTANGVTTTFTYPFKAFLTGDIDVYLNGVIQSSGYTITMRDTDGDVVFSSAPANGVEVAILRDVGTARNEVYTERGPFLGTTVNRDLDRRQALMQEVLARSIQQSPIEAARSGGALKLPPYDYGSFLGWGVGNQLENISPSVYVSGVGREVNSLADLRLITGNPADTYRTTKGYYTSGDGGGNSFYWDSASTATDNGGTVIKPTSVSGAGRWLAVNPSYVHVSKFGARGDGLSNDTTSINNAIVYANSISSSTNSVTVEFNDDAIYLSDGILVKSNVDLNFGGASVKKRTSGVGVTTNSLLRAVPVLSGSTYYGTYKNVKIIGGTFFSNGFSCPAHIINLVYCEDLKIVGTTVVHSSANTSWAYCIGGRRINISNVSVKGGTELFQDGLHILHGQYINIDGVYSESGDDSLALGGEPTDVYLAADPDSIRFVNASNINVNSQKASAVKIYVQSGATGTNWEVTDINIKNLSGNSGILRNGGIYITDENATAYGTSQIKRINISNASINIGSTSHDEVNAIGISVLSALNVRINGTIRLTDKTGAVTGFRVGTVSKSQDVELDIQVPAIAKNGGVSITSSKRVSVKGSMIGSSVQTQASILLNDAIDTLIDANLTNVPSGVSVVSLTAGTLTSLDLGTSKLGHASGAVAGVGLSTTASLFARIKSLGVDYGECFSPFASGSIPSGAAFLFADNIGALTLTRGQASIGSASTSIVVTHGAALVSASTSQILVTPDSSWGSATKWWISNNTGTQFTINCDIAPGVGFSFRWQIDTGRKPI